MTVKTHLREQQEINLIQIRILQKVMGRLIIRHEDEDSSRKTLTQKLLLLRPTVVADVHNEADESNRSSHTEDSLHVMFTELNEKITGKDLVNVMN